jgi:hypothetical protein
MTTHVHARPHAPGSIDRPAARTMSALARPGLVAHGALHVVIGLLALEVARSGGSEQADAPGALEALSSQPFGTALLVAMIVGLGALVLWRLAQAVWGDPVSGSDGSDRLQYAVRAVVYGALAASAVGVLAGDGGGSNDQQVQAWSARVMEWPAGQLLVGAAGLGLVALGAYLLWRHTVQATFMEQLDRSQMRGRTERAVQRLGQVGYAGRSVAFAAIGAFVVQAAARFDPQEARGLSASLQELAGSAWWPLLWGVAVGFVAYGILSFVLARYRRVA